VKEFNRTVRSSSRVKGQFKGRSSSSSVQEQFESDFRSLARLSVWLDQEEESVQLVPDGIGGTASAKQKLLKELV
jgi:hypothetical protein